MSDRYQQIANAPIASAVVGRLGLPQPVALRRHSPGEPVAHGEVVVGAARGGRLEKPIKKLLKSAGAAVVSESEAPAALIFDASGIDDSTKLRTLYDFFHPVLRSLSASGRVIVLGTPPESTSSPREATAQRAIEGFVRSVGKEIGNKGSTAQWVEVEPGAEGNIESTLRFLLSGRSAYVSGQGIRVGAGDVFAPADWERPLEGRTAIVTGASRGIGASIAETLARDGAEVVALDVPAQGEALSAVANRIGGSTLQLDITDPRAPAALTSHMKDRFAGVDIVVHNAGVTRDKTLARMSEEQWDLTLDINLSSQERINDALLSTGALRKHGRIVSVSSMSGIAGNRGQSNYAASKAGIIGMVRAMAPQLAEAGSTINAVAPGFIETAMTDAMPFATREAGRRMNSVLQGGLPVDVAETISWFASPASGGLNGNVVRVCGQNLLGA
jgi:3-oxoacyl-[acyl-carrier protein] reductase